MRNAQQPKKIKAPKVAGIIGTALLAMVYALISIPGGFFSVILFLSVLIMAAANLSIFFKNLRKNIFESLFAIISIFAAGYVFFKVTPAETYRSPIIMVAKPDNNERKRIAFRENGLISVSPKTIKSIFTNTEAFYEIKNDTIIIYQKADKVADLISDTSFISGDKIISLKKTSNETGDDKQPGLLIIEDNR